MDRVIRDSDYRGGYGSFVRRLLERSPAALLALIGSTLVGWGIGKSQGRPGIGLILGLGAGFLVMAAIAAMDRD